MLTITLPPELEEVFAERAEQQGTTPELLILDDLRGRYLPLPRHETSAVEGETMADFFAGYIGSIDSSDIAPGGSDLSENTENKLRELIMKKYREGKL